MYTINDIGMKPQCPHSLRSILFLTALSVIMGLNPIATLLFLHFLCFCCPMSVDIL